MFYDNLKKLCDERKTSISAVAISLGLDKSIGSTWKRGASPTGDILIKLSDKLNCSVDYLLGRTDNPNAHKAQMNGVINQSNVNSDNSTVTVNSALLENDGLMQEFINVFKELRFDDKVKVMDFVNKLKIK